MAEKRRYSARVKTETPKKRARLEKPSPKPSTEASDPNDKAKDEAQSKANTKASERASERANKRADAVAKSGHRVLPIKEHIEREKLDPAELKSIAESGVLAASLRQSRQHWLMDGVLQRYWIKPAKKKDQKEISNNPPKDSMQKIGSCTLRVDPHCFDVTVYIVRDPPSAHPKPAQRSFVQYGPPGPFPYQHPSSHGSPQHPQQQHAFPRPHGSPASAPHQSPVTQHPPAGSPPQAPRTGQDPVIQMLATRASTNPELKALMKVVASGEATQEQLRIFQSHIDDLNAILQRQYQTEGQLRAAQAQNQRQDMNAASPGHHQASSPQGNTVPFPVNHGSAHKHPAPPPLPRPVSSNPHINCILFEFAGGAGDRYLLPRHTMLEAVPGRQEFIASFLVVREGKDRDVDDVAHYDSDTQYYQPVTIRLATEAPRVFEAIWRSTAPPDDVVRHMQAVFRKAKRADVVHLEMQQPMEPNNSASAAAAVSSVTVESSSMRNTRASKARQAIDDLNNRCQDCFAMLTPADHNLAKSQPQSKGQEEHEDHGQPLITCAACSQLRRDVQREKDKEYEKKGTTYVIPGVRLVAPFDPPVAMRTLSLGVGVV